MSASLDFSKFNFTAEQIRNVKDLLWDEVIKAPEIQDIHTVFSGIVYDKQVGFIGEGSEVGVAKQACGTQVAQAFSIATRAIKWEPKQWEIYIKSCSDDLEATAGVYSLKMGVNIDDLTDIDYTAIVLEVLVKKTKDFIIRICWFGDVDADTIANGGTLKNGTSKGLFNIFNGFFKQMATVVSGDASKHVTISENAGASYAAQALSKTTVQGYLESLYFNADIRLRSMSDSFILCTQSFADAYKKSLTGTEIQTMYSNLVDGVPTLNYQGVKLIPIPSFDKYIKTYFDNGTKWNNPHRAIYIAKSVLAVGVDATNSLGDVKVWFNPDTDETKIKQAGKMDAKLANPDLFMIAI